MNDVKKRYIILAIFGVVMLLVAVVMDLTQVKRLFYDFMIVVVAFGLGITIKLVINQYTSMDQYYFLSALAVGSIFKFTIIMFIYYTFMANVYCRYNSELVAIQCHTIDLVSFVLAYLLPKYWGRKLTHFNIIIGFVVVSVISIKLPKEMMMPLLKGEMLMCIAISLMGYLKWKQISEKLMDEQIPFFKFQFLLMFLQYIFCFGTLGELGKYNTIVFSLQFLQILFLFHFAFFICLSSPWKNRVNALNKAEHTIHAQARNCDMIVNLSHELKTPVNVIRSALDILKMDLKEKEMISYVKGLKRSCNSVMNIIQDMIDIQKINGNHRTIKGQTYNLVEIVEDIMDAFSEEVEGSHLIFNPEEEEINQKIDVIVMQQFFVLLFGKLIELDPHEKLYVEMREVQDEKKIIIEVEHKGIIYLEHLHECLKDMSEEMKKKENVGDLLTYKLIEAILKMQNATMLFKLEEKMPKLMIEINKQSEDEVVWLDERSVAILKDKIRCRYVEG